MKREGYENHSVLDMRILALCHFVNQFNCDRWTRRIEKILDAFFLGGFDVIGRQCNFIKDAVRRSQKRKNHTIL